MTKHGYSVAQHSVYVSLYVERALTQGTYENLCLSNMIHQKLMESAGHGGTSDQFAYWDRMQDMMKVAMEDDHRRKQYALHGLAHDCHEAYLTDIPTPVKCIPGVREALKPVEEKLDSLIFNKIGIEASPERWPNNWEFSCMVVKWADMLGLQVEAYNLMPSRGLSWGIPMGIPNLDQLSSFHKPVNDEKARMIFGNRLAQLVPEKSYD